MKNALKEAQEYSWKVFMESFGKDKSYGELLRTRLSHNVIANAIKESYHCGMIVNTEFLMNAVKNNHSLTFSEMVMWTKELKEELDNLLATAYPKDFTLNEIVEDGCMYSENKNRWTYSMQKEWIRGARKAICKIYEGVSICKTLPSARWVRESDGIVGEIQMLLVQEKNRVVDLFKKGIKVQVQDYLQEYYA